MLNLICTTVLIEKSPQALPLGAACVASAIKNSSKTKELFSPCVLEFCLESEEIKSLVSSIGPGQVKNASGLHTGRYIAQKIASQKPDAVLMSIFVWNHIILEECARELKKICPKVLIIAGGPETTANPFNFEGIDFTVAGTGEGAVPELLFKLVEAEFFAEDFPHKNSSALFSEFNIPGVFYLGGKNLSRSTMGRMENFSRTVPLPPEKLSSPYLDGTINIENYDGVLWELARGCPFKCSYCYESKGEDHVSYFPMERLEKELELFSSKKIAQAFVLDPTYNANQERAIKMLDLIRQKAPEMFFYFEARAEFIDRKLAKAFSCINCALQIGLQSSDEKVLEKVHRTIDKKKFIKNTGFLNEAGVVFGFDLIYGLPGDNLKGFKNSIDFALSLYPNNLELFCLSVLPGTKLADDAKKFGIVWERTPPYHVISTPEFSESDLEKAARLARATNLFYTQGRAVSWFNCILYHLKSKPSVFLDKFEKFLHQGKVTLSPQPSPFEIRKIQKDFVAMEFKKQKMDKFLPVVFDLIELYGALSDADGEGKTSIIKLNYSPESLLSEYAQDLPFFISTQNPRRNKTKVFPTPAGADFTIL